jgi:hypothetical protein
MQWKEQGQTPVRGGVEPVQRLIHHQFKKIAVLAVWALFVTAKEKKR